MPERQVLECSCLVAHQVILRGGERRQAEAARMQRALLGRDRGLLRVLRALCMLPRLLPGCPGAAHWRLRTLLLLLVILGDALLKTEPCSRDGSAWTRGATVKSPSLTICPHTQISMRPLLGTDEQQIRYLPSCGKS